MRTATHITELEGQVAEAAKNAEAAERLRGDIVDLKTQGESDRIDFKLRFADVLNSSRRMVRVGHNAKEILIPKISVTGLGDYTRNVGYKTGAITYEFEAKAESDIDSFFGGGTTSFLENDVEVLDDFELVCFLAVRPQSRRAICVHSSSYHGEYDRGQLANLRTKTSKG